MPSAPRSQFESIVVSNISLCREHYRLALAPSDFPATEPGQFVQISCRLMDDADNESERELDWTGDRPPALSNGELCRPIAMLRRPFSLAGRRDTEDGVELDIIHRVVGVGTEWLSRLKPGDSVHLLGPLGNRFALPEPGALAVLVGGGVGIPPMLYLAQRLAGRPAVAFCGALSRDLLPFTLREIAGAHASDVRPANIAGEFAEHGIPSVITTDDGSFGFRGFVTQALEQYLDTTRVKDAVIYTCGPEPMMRRVAEIAGERGLPCQIAVERAMACGMGTCQSCVIRVRHPGSAGRDWVYRLACTDGPIFTGDELLW